MPIAVLCPSCAARITAPDKLAGKTAKCPKCQAAFVLPSADSGFEVVEDDEPVVALPKKKPPAVDPGFEVVEDDESMLAKPRKKARRPVEDDDEDSDLDDRPVKRKKGKKASSPKWMYAAIGGVFVLVVVGVGLWFLLSNPPKTGAKQVQDEPFNWMTHRLPGQQFSVALPGTPQKAVNENLGGGDGLPTAKMEGWELNRTEIEYKVLVLTFSGALPAWATDDAILKKFVNQLSGRANRTPGVKMSNVSLGNRAGQQAEFLEEGEYTIMRATMVNGKLFAFFVLRKNKPIDSGEEIVKRFFESVTFH